MSAVRPLDWINEVEASLIELDQKPQFGLPHPLNWQQLEKKIHQSLGKDFKLTYTFKGWVAHNHLFAGLGGKLQPLTIEWTPLQPPAFFITDQQNLKDLMVEMFDSEEAGNFFYESPYVQAFYNYFASEMLHILDDLQFASPLTPRLGPKPEDIRQVLNDEACFVIDLNLSLKGKNYWGRVLLSESFRLEWKKYFTHQGPPRLTDELKEKLAVNVGLEVAHSYLNLEQWQKVKNGDVIVLDHCSYDPKEHKGAVILTLNQKPVLRGRFKDGGIKITNYPVYEEASDAMDDDSFEKKFGYEDDEDEDDDEDSLYGDLDDDDDEDSEFEDEDEEEDSIFAGLEPKKKSLRAEKELDDDEDEEEDEDERVEKPPVKAKLVPTEESPSIAAADLPIRLTVEVGRVQMTAGSLMSLAPGNLLELNVSPEKGVDLVVNGKKVGRGELVRMGDVLGVRILSL